MTKKFLDSVYDHPDMDVADFYDDWAATYEAEVGDNGYVTPTRCAEALRAQVAPFTPHVVEERTGVPAAQLVDAARLFARSATAGANAGTGSNMSPHGTLAEYLLACMVTICGFHARAGDPAESPSASRTARLTGRTYVASCLDGNTEVPHVDEPIVTRTGMPMRSASPCRTGASSPAT